MRPKAIILSLITVLLLIGVSISYEHGTVISEKAYMYMVSHSEYWAGEEGQIIARLYDWQGDPIIVDNCTVDIYYPDKSLFINDGVMDDSLQATTGTHWYNFTTPTIEGVYEYTATCNWQPNKQQTVANSFHLSPALNFEQDIYNNLTEFIGIEEDHFNNLTLNLTNIKLDTDWLRANVLTDENARNNFTAILDNQNTMITDLGYIMDFCGDSNTNSSALCQLVYGIDSQLVDINNTLNVEFASITTNLYEINQTTQNTYNYVTGTLASNINTLLSRTQNIEDNTIAINSTVNSVQNDTTTIVQNQEDQVYFSVIS